MNHTHHTRLTVALISCFASSVFLLAGCSSAPELLKDTWEITAVRGQRIDSTQSLMRRPMFRFFEENKVQGFTGCNMFFGTFTQREDTVEFSPLMTSKMACTDRDNIALEERILEAFTKTARVRRSGQKLEFLSADEIVLMTSVGIPNVDRPVPAQELPR